MPKERRTIAIDAELWAWTQQTARDYRVSASWVAEEALRAFRLKEKKRNQRQSEEAKTDVA